MADRVRSPVGAGDDGGGAGDDGGDGRSGLDDGEIPGQAGYDGGDGRSGPAMTRTDRHCRLDRQSQKDYLYIRKTIGYGAEGICVFYDEWE